MSDEEDKELAKADDSNVQSVDGHSPDSLSDEDNDVSYDDGEDLLAQGEAHDSGEGTGVALDRPEAGMVPDAPGDE